MKLKAIAAGLILMILGVILPISDAPRAAAQANTDAACTGLTVVFARGSGQKVGHSKESDAFMQRLTNELNSGAALADMGVSSLTPTTYELGSSSVDGYQYRAVGLNALNVAEAEASWTGFLGGKYRSSVFDGVKEFTNYLIKRYAACPNDLFVLGGYSQGANVIGDALPGIPLRLRDRIAYVAFFGDPKLYLPEGAPVLGVSKNCANRSLTAPWRRGDVGCTVQAGSLDARVPYVPHDLENRTGSWCDLQDGVCNGSSVHGFLFAADGLLRKAGLKGVTAHSEYPLGGASSEITQATREAAAKVRARFSPYCANSNTPHCERLVQLYKATDGPNWQNNNGWLSTSDVCQWFGVVCRGKFVSELHLTGNKLSGQMTKLPESLDHVDLSRNKLRGSIPTLPRHLQRLNLSHNLLSGVVPHKTSLPHIESANLQSNCGLYPSVNSIPLKGEISFGLKAECVELLTSKSPEEPKPDPNLAATQVAVGAKSSCALLKNGEVHCWGRQFPSSGATGSEEYHHLGALTKVLEDVVELQGSLDSQWSHDVFCAIKTTGRVACWGGSYSPEYGVVRSDIAGVTDAVQVDFFNSLTDEACARTKAGKIYCWGPEKPAVMVEGVSEVAEMWLPGYQICGKRTDQTVFCAERAGAEYAVEEIPGFKGALKIVSLRGVGPSGGQCALLSDGTVKCAGDNLDNQLNLVSGKRTSSQPVQEVKGVGRTVDIASNGSTVCAVEVGGTVKCWGFGLSGLIVPGPEPQLRVIKGVSNAIAIRMEVGSSTACAIHRFGGLSCWEERESDLKQTLTISREPANAIDVEFGTKHLCSLNTGGQVACWGKDNYGETGIPRSAKAPYDEYTLPKPRLVDPLKYAHPGTNAVPKARTLGAPLPKCSSGSIYSRDLRKCVEEGKFTNASVCSGGLLEWVTGDGYWWITVGSQTDERAYMDAYAGGSTAASIRLENVPSNRDYVAKLWHQKRSGEPYLVSDTKTFKCGSTPAPKPTPTATPKPTAPTPTPKPVDSGSECPAGFVLTYDKKICYASAAGRSCSKGVQSADGRYCIVPRLDRPVTSIGSFYDHKKLCSGEELWWAPGPGYWWVTIGNDQDPRAYLNGYGGGSSGGKIKVGDLPVSGEFVARLWHQERLGEAYKVSDTKRLSCQPAPNSTPEPSTGSAAVGKLIDAPKLCAGDSLNWGPGSGYWWMTVGTRDNPRAYMNAYAGGSSASSITLDNVPASGEFVAQLWRQQRAGDPYQVSDSKTFNCQPASTGGSALPGKFVDAAKLCSGDQLAWGPGSGYWWVTVGDRDNQRAYMDAYAGGSASSSITVSNVPATGTYTAFLWNQAAGGGAYRISDSKEFSCSPAPSGETTRVGAIVSPASANLCSGDQIRWSPGDGYWWVTIGDSNNPRTYMDAYAGGSSSDSVTASGIPSETSDVVVNLWRQPKPGDSYQIIDTKSFSCGVANTGGGSSSPGQITRPAPNRPLCSGDQLGWNRGDGHWWVTIGTASNPRAYMNSYAGGSTADSITVDMVAAATNPVASIWRQKQPGQPYELVSQTSYTTCNR